MDFLISHNIEFAYQKALESPLLQPHLRSKINEHITAKSSVSDDSVVAKVSLTFLEEISSFLINCDSKNGKDISQSKFWVHELLKGAKIYFEVSKPKPRSKELEQRLKNISRDINNQDYYRMVSGVDPNFYVPATPRNPDSQLNPIQFSEAKETKQQITAIINVLFTVVAVFVAVYWVSYTVTSVIGWRVLLSLFSSIFVGVAETFLYVRHIQKDSSQMRSL